MEDGNANASDVQSEERINAWEQFHEILYKEYRHLLPNASSETALSVSYATRPDPQILEQNGPELSISLDRARDLVASLPESARQALLAPIHLGLLDLQSVFYLKDNTSMSSIAICVEDYLQLVAARYASWHTQTNLCTDEKNLCSTEPMDEEVGEAETPSRLLAALSLVSNDDSTYCKIDEESIRHTSGSSAQSQSTYCNSLVLSVSVDYAPPVPSSPPPPLIHDIKQDNIKFESSLPHYRQLSGNAERKKSKICSRNIKIAASLTLTVLIIVCIVAVELRPGSSAVEHNDVIDVQLLSQSDNFFTYDYTRTTFTFDYNSSLAFVTFFNSNDTAQTFIWNGSFSNMIEIDAYVWPHCATVALYNGNPVYCCYQRDELWCVGPNRTGIIYPQFIHQPVLAVNMLDFINIDGHPTLLHLTLVESQYFTLTFHPFDTYNWSRSEVYNTSTNCEWQFVAATQMRRSDHSLSLLLKIQQSAEIFYVICNYQLVQLNRTLQRSGCIELDKFSSFLINDHTNNVAFHYTESSKQPIWTVAFFQDTLTHGAIPSADDPNRGSNALILIAYDLNGKIIRQPIDVFETTSAEIVNGFHVAGSPQFSDRHIFVFMQNNLINQGYLLQYEFVL